MAISLVVTENEFKEWLNNPVTKEFKKYLVNELEFGKDALLNVKGIEDLNYIQGGCAAIDRILNLEFEQMVSKHD